MSLPEPAAAGPHTPDPVDLRDLADEVAALAAARGAAAALADDLAARVALLEALEPGPAPGPGGAGQPYRYRHLADWVDEVFARLAAGHRAKWCTSWESHPEARLRLEVLWHTWESASAAGSGADPDWATLDDWLRIRLDHHTAVLLDVDGPFAGCVPARGGDPGRCSAPPRLAQRPPAVSAQAQSLALLEAHRARRRSAAAQP